MALSAPRYTLREDEHVLPSIRSYPTAASQTFYPGAMVALNTSGLAVPAAPGSSRVVGVYEGPDVLVTPASGMPEIRVRRGAFWFANKGGDLITQALIATQKSAYVEDDGTVRATATGSIVAGIAHRVDSAKGVLVEITGN